MFTVNILLHKLRECARVYKLKKKKKRYTWCCCSSSRCTPATGAVLNLLVCITSPVGVLVWKVKSRKHIRYYQKKLSEQDRTKWGDALPRAYGLVYTFPTPKKQQDTTLWFHSDTQLKLWHMHTLTQLQHWHMDRILLLQHTQQLQSFCYNIDTQI